MDLCGEKAAILRRESSSFLAVSSMAAKNLSHVDLVI